MALLILAHHRRATPGELDGTGWASRPRALALFSPIVKTRRVAACLVILAVAVTAHAQQPGKPWRIGYLAQAASAVGADTLGEFKRGLSELGYVDGQHYLLLVRDAGGRPDRLQTLATELASAPVDVIVTGSTPPALAAMRATRAIPIVMAISADPVANGLVQSLSRPGGNVTGMALAFDEVSRSMRVMLAPLEAAARALNV